MQMEKIFLQNGELHYSLISSLPVFTPDGTIGLPSVRPSVRLSAKNLDNFKTIKARRMQCET